MDEDLDVDRLTAVVLERLTQQHMPDEDTSLATALEDLGSALRSSEKRSIIKRQQDLLARQLLQFLRHHSNLSRTAACERGVSNAIRVLGNLSVDNQAMRDLVHEERGLPLLMQYCTPSTAEANENRVKYCVGAVANLINDHAKLTQEALECGAVDRMAAVFFDPQSSIVARTLAGQALINGMTCSRWCGEIVAKGGIDRIVALLSDEDEVDMHVMAVQLLTGFGEDQADCLAQSGAIKVLVDYLEENQSDYMSSQECIEGLISVAKYDPIRRALCTERCIDLLTDMLHEAAQNGADEDRDVLDEDCVDEEDSQDLVEDILELLAQLSVEKDSDSFLYKPTTLDQLRTMSAGSKLSTSAIRNCLMIIGNMATNNDRSIALIRANMGRLFVSFSGSHDIKLKHMALSGLRNLAIPAENKQPLFALGALDAAIACLKDGNEAILNAAVAVLRNLVTNCEENAVVCVTKLECIPTSQVEKTQIEIGRLVYNLSQTKERLELLASRPALVAISTLLRSTHAILQAEGTRALSVLLSSARLGSEELQTELKSRIRENHRDIITTLELIAGASETSSVTPPSSSSHASKVEALDILHSLKS